MFYITSVETFCKSNKIDDECAFFLRHVKPH